jgi:hypothetical protein
MGVIEVSFPFCPKCRYLVHECDCNSTKGYKENKEYIKYLEDARVSYIEEVSKLKEENEELRRQLSIQRENNHTRNLELDALHYVWCDGGCKTGIHRWTDQKITAELVETAVRNTTRLIHWYLNFVYRDPERRWHLVPWYTRWMRTIKWWYINK